MKVRNIWMFLWKAAWLATPLLAFSGIFYLMFGYHFDPPASDNPMRPKTTWQEAELQDKAQADERQSGRLGYRLDSDLSVPHGEEELARDAVVRCGD